MAPVRSELSRPAISALLGAGLNALKRGHASALTNRHRRLRDVLHRQALRVVMSTLGDTVPTVDCEAFASRILLHWALAQLRPDQRPTLENIDEYAWLHSTSWRPLLALACHHGALSVPHFPGRYRKHPDESAIENLCGIWAVGHSTVYRYLEKGRRQVIEILAQGRPAGRQLVSLRRATQSAMEGSAPPAHGWATWHHARAAEATVSGMATDALWHLVRAGDGAGVIETLVLLKRHSSEAAHSPETDILLEEFESQCPLQPQDRIELGLRRAVLWHCRQEVEREGDVLHKTLRLAESLGQPLSLGKAQAALARFFEERDRDRAIACYESSLPCLRTAIEHGGGAEKPAAVDEYANCVVHLAWLHLRRNNPKAKALLEQLPGIGQGQTLSLETEGALEQTWGEYWRCLGNPRKALEHKHKALTIFERLGDRRSVLSTYNNLGLLYADIKEYAMAKDYAGQVVAAASSGAVEPELLSSAHCNLGVAHFGLGQTTEALEHYERSLMIDERAGLSSHAIVALYNLAEAHYERFKQLGDPADESLGDSYSAAAVRRSNEANSPAQAEAAHALKREILGTGDGPDRLLPSEHAAHFSEMSEIERLRMSLALPQGAEQQVRIHLAIARAYTAIATKEREAALAIVSRHHLATDDFQAELDTLRTTFSRELTREQQLEDDWQSHSNDLLVKDRRHSILAHLLAQGSINKSTYAEVAAVSLATASKHLGVLAERGLLVQTGKGPSTRYLLKSP